MKKENSYSTEERRTIELSRRLDKHDPDAILEALQDGSYFCKVKAMITCSKTNIISEEIIEAIKPNVLVKGGDYKLDNIVGADYISANGGRVLTIPFIHKVSTTHIINKIKL